MNKATAETAKKAVSIIWATVYRSTQAELTWEQITELETAMGNLRFSMDSDDLVDRRANFVHQCAQKHLSALMSIDGRKPTGVEGLLKDCENLQRMLESVEHSNE